MDIKRLQHQVILLDYEVRSDPLKSTIDEVLQGIPDKYADEFPSFSIYGGPAVEGAHVEPDAVYFDIDKLNAKCDENRDAVIGIIAHEFAHVFLRHTDAGDDGEKGLRHEREADEMACRWGFSSQIEALRRQCGPPTPCPDSMRPLQGP